MSKMLTVTMYCDQTPLYSEREIEEENLCDLDFPEEIVRAWYAEHEEDCIAEQRQELGKYTEPSFESWFYDVCTADAFDGFYEFAAERGYEAQREDQAEIDEMKREIARAAVRLMDLLDNCCSEDFIDTVVDAVRYNDSGQLTEYLD